MTLDMLRLLESPECSVIAVIIDIMIRKCIAELSYHCGLHPEPSNNSDSANGYCKNVSYANFLIDLIGIMASQMCGICTLVQREIACSETIRLPENVITALQAMLGIAGDCPVSEVSPVQFTDALLLTESIPNGQIESSASVTDGMTLIADNSGAVESCGEGTHVSQEQNIPPSRVVRLVSEIMAAALDLITQSVEQTDATSIGAQRNRSNGDSILLSATVPSPRNLLSQCGIKDECLE